METARFPDAPGTYKMTFSSGGMQSLRYTLSLPSSYNVQNRYPLVMALHYGGKVTPFYGGEYLLQLVKPALKKLGAVMVAPDCPNDSWENPESEKAVFSLRHHLETKLKIEKGRNLLTGFSLGGMGTWYLAARHPETFSAYLPVSGMPGKQSIEELKNVPIYAIHSTGDEIFPVNTMNTIAEKLKARGIQFHYVTVKGISHYRTELFVPPLQEAVPWIEKIWSQGIN
ncbi:MAG: hypothetical protein GY757_13595 [bacterium]|nr:hypothetical protein [bacterium]